MCFSYLAALLTTILFLPSKTQAQPGINYNLTGRPPDPGLKLLQDEPHDLVFFTEKSGGGWAKVYLLPFPGRKLPPNTTGALRLNIISLEDKELVCNWKDIDRIELWEPRLEKEVKERVAKKDFVGAYPFLAALIRDNPNRPGLRDLRCDFIWQDALTRARKGEWESTLAMLEELRRYAPEFKRSDVKRAMDGVVNKLAEALIRGQKFDLAKQLLSRLAKDYASLRLASLEKWNLEFVRLAQEKQDLARAAFEKKDYRNALLLIRESRYLQPDLPGNDELVKEIQQTYPMVNVGVLQTATVFEPTRIDNWAARRAGRLVYRTMFEIQGAGPEGGEYEFIFGDSEASPSRLEFDLRIEPQRLDPPLNQIDGVRIADTLANRASLSADDYFAPWAAVVETIQLQSPTQVSFNLRRPHVLPTCLLQVLVDGSWFGGKPGSTTGDYAVGLYIEETGETKFDLKSKPKTPDQPREILETRMRSGTKAVNMLLRGEIDMIDQLFPADAVRLENSRAVKVGRYPLPTVHMLIPCSDHPYLAEATFRRGLLYGINRADILKGQLLENQEFEGCRVLSGPFPAGIDENDPLSYAYDERILPRSYEPSLARLLITMNANQMRSLAERKDEKFEEMTPLRLAYPADNLSRLACEAIVAGWGAIGIPSELVELPVGRTFPNEDEDIADLVYVSAAVWEPIIDARRLLGPEGLAGSTNQFIAAGLRKVEEAKNWPGVRQGLVLLHSTAHNELPVLPLWQMVDSYAYRRELIGVGSDIVSLYQNADNWRISR
ncbi:MAG: ABC transporter substrate-binding protein [Planctomycetota bacterium]